VCGVAFDQAHDFGSCEAKSKFGSDAQRDRTVLLVDDEPISSAFVIQKFRHQIRDGRTISWRSPSQTLLNGQKGTLMA